MSEPTRDGVYFVRLFEGSDWQVAQYSGREWFVIAAAEGFREVAEVGPEVVAPE